MSEVIILDSGNETIKSVRWDGSEDKFTHALIELSSADLRSIRSSHRGELPVGYAVVNDKFYAYGEIAERYGDVIRRQRASKFTKDYYGVIAAIALSRQYEQSGTYSLFGSHAPGDVEYRDELMASAMGNWTVEFGAKISAYKINYCNTFDEPLGGLYNLLLTKDGTQYQRPEVGDGRTLMFDVGGGTTSLLGTSLDGTIDHSLRLSVSLGIINVIASFETLFRETHRKELQDVDTLPISRVREAIRTGVLKLRGKDIPCEEIVVQAVNLLLNPVMDLYRTKTRGGSDFDTIG